MSAIKTFFSQSSTTHSLTPASSPWKEDTSSCLYPSSSSTGALKGLGTSFKVLDIDIHGRRTVMEGKLGGPWKNEPDGIVMIQKELPPELVLVAGVVDNSMAIATYLDIFWILWSSASRIIGSNEDTLLVKTAFFCQVRRP
ncbi:hypothetical protein CVT26_008488 [Gymnopilus dilepis]|uniref:Uncharacterized protein n=1 Tax=Gymnopilus dilepis TaxID=231916 RepID=A0A409XXH8_9AGAR|nr:hypothetical protein CVT26_008488 [Gymnopilus dilepis]